MIRKNILKTLTITALAAAMALTACSKDTGTTPETQPAIETAAPETTGENLVSTEENTTEETTTTKKADTTEETTTAEQTSSTSKAEESNGAPSTEAPATESETTTTVHTHNYSSSITKEAACTSEGVKTYSCECGHSYTESIPALGHSFDAYTYNNDATEDADGTETAVCSVCGEQNTRTAAGTKLEHVHSYTPYVSSYPTCTAEGVMTSTCECGDSYTEPINATGHSFGEYVYNNDATYEADGTETATCSVCGAKDTRTAAGTKLVQETTEAAKNTEELQSFFDWLKENLNAYSVECIYAQEGFMETFPFVWDVSDTQYCVFYVEGGDTSPVDNFIKTHDMTIWDKIDYPVGEYKEGRVHEVMFARNSY